MYVYIFMCRYFLEEKDDVFVFFYDQDDSRSKKIIKVLEQVDDDLDEENINLVKCSDDDVDETYGIGYLPRLVYFQRGIPEAYDGDETKSEAIVAWAKEEVADEGLVTVNRAILDRLVEKFDHLGGIFVDDENKDQMALVLELESNVAMIEEEELDLALIDDSEYAEDLGLGDPPTLVHFSNDVPSVYYGEETVEQVLEWLTKQKNEFNIEVVTGPMLADLVDDEEFVAVLYRYTAS